MAAAPLSLRKSKPGESPGCRRPVSLTFGTSASLGQRGFEGQCSSTERTSRGFCIPEWTTPSGSYQRRVKASCLVSCQVDEDLLQRLWTLLLWQPPQVTHCARARHPLGLSHAQPGPSSTQERFLLSPVQGRLQRPRPLPLAHHQHKRSS